MNTLNSRLGGDDVKEGPSSQVQDREVSDDGMRASRQSDSARVVR